MVIPLGDAERTAITPVVTYVLITLNVAAYLFQQTQPESFTVAFAATPYEITHREDLPGPVLLKLPGEEDPLGLPGRVELRRAAIPQGPVPFPVWFTLLTSMFLHGSPLHLAGNMLYLWIFGDNVEEVLGPSRFLAMYLASGLVGSLAQILVNPDSMIPTLGASGAIAGVMGAYLIWFPRHRIRVLVLRFLVVMPALAVIGLWIAMQAWLGLGSIGKLGEAGGVAYLAHLGGAVVGLAVAFALRDRSREVVLRKHREGRSSSRW